MGAACCSKNSAATEQSVLVAKTDSLPTQTRRALTLSDINDLSVVSESGRPIKWQRGDLIGEGTYAKVYQCLSEGGELLAVKIIPFGKSEKEVEKGLDKAKKEVKLMRQLSHPNIVKHVQTDVSEQGDSVHILMEFISGGSLKALVKKYASLDEVIIKRYAEQVLRGLAYLHSHRIIHRDLKGANILLTPEGTIKLTDFGSSARLPGEDEPCLSMKGSPYWMAPEVVSRTGHTTKADIWSFGCVLIEMKTGNPPWSDESSDTPGVLKLISTPDRLPNLPNGSADFISLLKLCLNRDPDQRPDALDLLQRPFFAKSETPARTGDEETTV